MQVSEETGIRVWVIGAGAAAILVPAILGFLARLSLEVTGDHLVRLSQVVGLLAAIAYVACIGLQIVVNDHVRTFLKQQEGMPGRARAWAHADPFRHL